MKDYLNFRAKDMVPRRRVKKGEIILTAEPFAYVLNNHHQGQYCDNCLASSRDKAFTCCKDCKFVWYCNDICMFAGSDVHKDECKALQRLHPFVPPSLTLLVARVMTKLRKGYEKHFEYYTESKGRKFKDLMNHYRDIKDDDKRIKEVRTMMKTLKRMMGEDNFPNESDFIGIYGRILVNRFCMTDSFMTAIGTAVYLTGSIFDHSCQPNAYQSFIGKKLVVRSLVDWRELDFTKVFICYIDVVSSTSHRRADLRANWYFWCYCPLCSSEERALYENCIKCENPFCGAHVQVPEKPASMFQTNPGPRLECNECGCPVDEDTIGEYQSAVAFTRHRLRGLNEDNPSLETCLAILEKQGDLFSSMNVWRVRALDFLFNAAYYRGMMVTALNYGKENQEGMKYYYRENHPSYGLFLMKLGKVALYLKLYREGLKYLDMAEKILIPAFGKDHLLLNEELPRLRIIANEDLDILIERKIEAKKREEHETICKHCGRRKKPQPKVEEEDDEDDLKIKMEQEEKKLWKRIEEMKFSMTNGHVKVEQNDVKKVETNVELKKEVNGEVIHDVEEEGDVNKGDEEIVVGKREHKKDYRINGHIDYSANAKYLKFLFPVK